MDKNRLISRQSAAEVLKCTQQTITNWVESGILKGHMVNHCLMIDSNTINAILDTAQDASRAQDRIKRIKKELEEEEKELQSKIDDTRRAIRLWNSSRLSELNKNVIYEILLSHKSLLNDVEIGIIKSFMEIGDINAIANHYDVRKSYIIKIFSRVIKKIHNAESYDILIDKIIKMELKINKLEEESKTKAYDDNFDYIKERLEIKLIDTELSIRAINALKCAFIYNMADLVYYKLSDIERFRCIGSKTLREIKDLVQYYGLEFGMKIPKNLLSNAFLENLEYIGKNSLK